MTWSVLYNDKEITTLGHQPDIYDVIRICGQDYIVGTLNIEKKTAKVDEINFRDYNTEDTRYPKCPHCGYEDIDAFEWTADEDETNCSRCNRPFYYTREIEISYTTERLGKGA